MKNIDLTNEFNELIKPEINRRLRNFVVAVLIFGGLWGIWGLFFAIPLATVVQAVLRAWPRHKPEPEQGSAEATPPENIAAE